MGLGRRPSRGARGPEPLLGGKASFDVPDAPGLDAERSADLRVGAPRLAAIQHALRSVASKDERVEHVDLAHVLTACQVVDGVHPDPFGADAIAERLAEAIEPRCTSPRRPP